MELHQKLQDKHVQKNVNLHNSNVVKTPMSLKEILLELIVHQDLFPLLTQSKFVMNQNHKSLVKIQTSDVVLMELAQNNQQKMIVVVITHQSVLKQPTDVAQMEKEPWLTK